MQNQNMRYRIFFSIKFEGRNRTAMSHLREVKSGVRSVGTASSFTADAAIGEYAIHLYHLILELLRPN